MVGKTTISGISYFALARYLDTGALDTVNFGAAGKLNTAIGTSDDAAYSVAISGSDGKIIVAGYSYNGANRDFAVVRYTSSGAEDTSFNGTGKVTTDFGVGDDTARSVLIQSDGKIVVAGSARVGLSDDFALVRYNQNGSLDNTFNGNGKVTTSIGGTESGNGVAIQSDGKIIVSGASNGGWASGSDFTLLRYNTDGTLDTTFGDAGVVTTAISSNDDECFAMALQPDEKIVAVGNSNLGNDGFATARYSIALPDARLGKNAAATVGNDIYNRTGLGQNLNTAITHGGGLKTDSIRIQNDGPVAASFKVRGTPGNANFSVQYLKGASDVTAKVIAGKYRTGTLAPGASVLLKAKITATTPAIGQKTKLSITATAVGDPAGVDRALIKVKSN
jgi:uncharacterized delta-60 repeat protein